METTHTQTQTQTQQNDAYWGSVLDGSLFRSWRYMGAKLLFAIFMLESGRLLMASYSNSRKSDFLAFVIGIAGLALLDVWTFVKASRAIGAARANATPDLRSTALTSFNLYYVATWFSMVVTSVALIFYK